ncbi:peptidoglycan DD-metalloendopeptidase family protein [bacterium]|nr:peptidoglycan DD-metalloendopeptidase family protein [bacterium]
MDWHVSRIRFFGVWLVVVLCTSTAPAKLREVHAADGSVGYLEEEDPYRPNCISPQDLAKLEADWAEYEKALAKGVYTPVSAYTSGFPGMYKFWPQAGRLWQELSLGNYTDLDPAEGSRRDWNCGTRNYDGHRGYDVSIPTFEEQAVGVPIFAILDGRVTSRSDGNPDMNTTWEGQPGNGCYIDHGNNYRILYWHMKNGSPTQYVYVGMNVRAGQQIGLTASSGNSTWPHLHFESQHRRTTSYQWFEPATGPCNVGDSSWENQMSHSWPETVLRYFKVAAVDLSDTASYNVGAPFYIPKTGTFERGVRTVHFWFNITIVGSGYTRRYRLLDPDGVQVTQSSSSTQSSGTWRSSFSNVNFNKTGVWRLQYLLNNAVRAEHPIRIVEPGAPAPNQPPYPAGELEFDPPAPLPTDVVFCRITKSSYRAIKDPDSDTVGYVYRWKVNGSVIREGTWAAQGDAIPWGMFNYGDVLSCEVTPWDGQAYGPTSYISTAIDPGPKPATLTIGAATAMRGQFFTLPADLTGERSETSFGTFGVHLVFDASRLSYQRALTGDLTNNWLVIGQENTPGRVEVVGSNITGGAPVSATGNLVNFEFTVQANAPLGETYLVPQNLSGGLASFRIESGTVSVVPGVVTPTPTPTVTPTPTRTPIPVADFDLNGDGIVDQADLLLLIEAYGESGSLRADFDGNQCVDGHDVLLFSEHWQEAVAPQ